MNSPGIELDGEGADDEKSSKKEDNWSGTTLPWMATGYECRLTPIQNFEIVQCSCQ
jgi:cell division protein FtsI (penicillin-binding protein 3)